MLRVYQILVTIMVISFFMIFIGIAIASDVLFNISLISCGLSCLIFALVNIWES